MLARSTWIHGQYADAPSLSLQRPHATFTPRGSPIGKLLGDTGLADARLASHQHQPVLPAQRAVEGIAELGEFDVTTDEGPTQ